MLDTKRCQEHFDKVIQKAKGMGMYEPVEGRKYDNPNSLLKSRLDYLTRYSCPEEDTEAKKTRCELTWDSAPLSFNFNMYIRTLEQVDAPGVELHEGVYYRFWFNGGLIFHGQHDNGGDGGAPTFAVNLVPETGWSIHT